VTNAFAVAFEFLRSSVVPGDPETSRLGDEKFALKSPNLIG
jgi:hypothetical protein